MRYKLIVTNRAIELLDNIIEYIVSNYKYIIFFQIDKDNNTIYIMGIFHHRELYNRKL